MTYIGGTLYAPIGFDLETFQEGFDRLAQASFEDLDPSAIGKGDAISGPDVRLKIKTAWIEESILLAIEAALSSMFYGIIFVVEAIGSEQAMPRPDYADALSDVVAKHLDNRQKAQQFKQERIERDVQDDRIRNMSTDELLSHGYVEEHKRRLEAEWEMSDAGVGRGDPNWFAG